MSALTEFDRDTLGFRTDPVAEALFLLRPVLPFAHLGPIQPHLPPTLNALVGRPSHVTAAVLRAHLAAEGINEADLGGSLDTEVARTVSGPTAGTLAKYFVIHDTSTTVSGNSFPASINTAAWPGNRLASFMGPDAAAHLFLNRVGESATGHDYSTPWRATKFESSAHGFGTLVKGLFLHNEMIQPRRLDSHGIDSISPDPGFPDEQYDRLALLYVAASLRRRKWMIPSFHCPLDEGIGDGHDDPQRFDLDLWDARLGALLNTLSGSATPAVLAAAPAVAPVFSAAPARELPAAEAEPLDISEEDWEPSPAATVISEVPFQRDAGTASDNNGSARTDGLAGTARTFSDGTVVVEATESLTARRGGHSLATTGACRIVIKGKKARIEQREYSYLNRPLPHAFRAEEVDELPTTVPDGFEATDALLNKRSTQFGKNDDGNDLGTGAEAFGTVQTCSEVWGASVKRERLIEHFGADFKNNPKRLGTLVEIYQRDSKRAVRVPLVDIGPGAANRHIDLTFAVDDFLKTEGEKKVDFRLLIPV